jgi:hypothetical protein
MGRIGGEEGSFAGFCMVKQEQAVAEAHVVLPTPPLPPKKRYGAVDLTSRNGSHELTFIQCAVDDERGVF